MKKLILTGATAMGILLSFSAQENLGVNQSNPTAKTHITNTQNQNSFRVDDESGDATPFVIDSLGHVQTGAKLTTDSLQVTDGASDGAILQSDANGNATWNEINIAVYQESTSSGGGIASIIGWQTRNLTTTQTQIGSKISVNLSSDEITIAPGTYKIFASAPSYQGIQHQLRLTNVITNATLLTGTFEYTNVSMNVTTRSTINQILTVTASTTFILDHFINRTLTYGGGTSNSVTGEDAIYATIYIEKIK
jgi:hypothetical protein